MEANQGPTNQPIQRAAPKLSAKPLIVGVVSVLILALIITTAFIFLPKTGNQKSNNTALPTTPPQSNAAAESTQVEGWKLPKSNKKGFPILGKHTDSAYRIYIYTFDDGKTTEIPGAESGWGGGAGMGSFEPEVSPNMLYTAFLNTKDNSLNVISHETLEVVKVPTQGPAGYITSWSPDSKNIAYYVFSEAIVNRTRGIRTPNFETMRNEKFAPNIKGGFHIFNIEDGKDTWIYPVEHFISFIDNDSVLTGFGDSQTDHLVSFNTKTFSANYDLSQEVFGFGANQFNISPDGKKWTLTLSRNPTSDANIIYADFPKKEGVIVESGAWADLQWPILSPDGSKIVYQKKIGMSPEGRPQNMLMIFDTKLQTKSELRVGGMPTIWVDNNTIIASTDDSDSNNTKYQIVDVAGKQVKTTISAPKN